MIDLAGYDDGGGQGSLVGLRTEPQHIALLGFADRAHNHLGGAGQNVCTGRDMGGRRFGGQGDI